ncbi:HD domain-containing protein [Ureibacillus manganicus]|uniref:Phosphohydrolase n=1 Tax=Ureibacillus manganicus DSM 26584 TaxID=1384049 RepID=A0A0A3I7G6_9BACL|nr:HD domain-containing protein [Ureibacillus manganicus]KGR79470.1 phosphohydrolase [Ureibacillus manganicus DSM 26584]
MIESMKEKVKIIYEQFDASHDFDHIMRVLQNAEAILASEASCDKEIVRLAVLLHDVSDKKYSESKDLEQQLINELEISEDKKQHIRDIIASVSFNGGNELPVTTIEAKIVRDADRLDAIGAIGIARTFAYGGAKGRKLYDESEEVRLQMSEDDYRSKSTASVTHFYEKLLLLKDLMTTVKGKQMAEERHAFMISFLQQLKMEIKGEA